MDRFFCPLPLQPNVRLRLPDTLAHHAMRVRRLKDGAAIVLFDGLGGEYPATLAVDGHDVHADVLAHRAIERELRGALTLAQGIATADKMDWIIEKAVELGVQRFIPIAAERSVLKLAGPRLDKRLARWRNIVAAASEQCGRNRLMQIHAPCTLAESSTHLQGCVLFCQPRAASTLPQALRPAPNQLSLLIGPEGGWSAAEQRTIQDRGYHSVQLGPRILRTETAGLAVAAAAAALLDW